MARIGQVIREVYRRPGTDEVPAHLVAQYGIEVAGVTRLDAGVLKIDRRDGPPWVARLFVSTRPIERARGDAEVLRFLERQRFPAERCAHPEPVSALDGRAVLVTEYVDGKRPPNSPAVRRRLGEALGRTHALSTEPGPTERPAGSLHHLPNYEGGPQRDLDAAAALLADLEGRVPPKHRATFEAIQALLPRGDGGDGLPEAFLHPDPARVNVVVGPGREPVLVDWTGAGRGPRLAAFAVLVSGVAPHHVPELLSGYGAHVTLSADEVERVEGILWIRPLWLAAWQCWLACVSSQVDRAFVPDPARIASLAAAVRSAWSEGSGPRR